MIMYVGHFRCGCPVRPLLLEADKWCIFGHVVGLLLAVDIVKASPQWQVESQIRWVT
jgi:hypothetical protein